MQAPCNLTRAECLRQKMKSSRQKETKKNTGLVGKDAENQQRRLWDERLWSSREGRNYSAFPSHHSSAVSLLLITTGRKTSDRQAFNWEEPVSTAHSWNKPGIFIKCIQTIDEMLDLIHVLIWADFLQLVFKFTQLLFLHFCPVKKKENLHGSKCNNEKEKRKYKYKCVSLVDLLLDYLSKA